MSKFYFAKHKETQELYVGVKYQAGFAKLGSLRSSITYGYAKIRVVC